jgi:amidase
MDLVDALSALAGGEVGGDELTAAAVARAHEANAALNAVVTWVPPAVAGEGPFAGVPSFLKDNEDLSGFATSHGSRATSRQPVHRNGAFAAEYLALGFGVLGKTTLPEFGLTASTEPLAQGPTRNPWDLARSTGGSSGGSAALVAAGVVPIAHANDGGGSIRIPASCCGLVGLKPSRGRVTPPDGIESLPVQIAEEGVLTRSVRDTALFYREYERLGQGAGRFEPLATVTGPSARRLRIGVAVNGLGGLPVGEDVARTTLDTALLCEGLGHNVEQVPLPFDQQVGKDFLRYWAFLAFGLEFGGGRLYGPDFRRDELEPFSRGLSRFCRSIAPNIPASIRRLRRFSVDYARAFADFDVLLTPVLAHEPPEIGYLAPDIDFDTHLLRLLRYASFTAMQNISGAPAISMPLGFSSEGLPIGVQAMGAFGQDARLLELAFELEAATIPA